MQFSYNLNEINAASKKFLELVKNKSTIAFHGQMGAGKTTFISALCRQLGVKENISSPTFSIINEYAGANGKKIFHIDFYRLKNEEEALHAGVENCFDTGDVVFIEWPEIAPGILPQNTLHVFIKTLNDNDRLIEFEANS